MIGFVRDQIEMKDVYINEGSGGGGDFLDQNS